MHLAPHLIAHRGEFEAAFASADAMAGFEGPTAWSSVCGAFQKVNAIRRFSKREELAYAELSRQRDASALRSRLQADIEAGSVCAAFAAIAVDAPRHWPLAAWACPPESSPDARLDLGLLRVMLWMEFDPDARGNDGFSALDLMLGLKRGRHCQPRGAAILLQAGADPDAVDAHGDTPLLSLARSEHWCEDRNACARALIEHGADFLATNAGDDLASRLRQAEAAKSSHLRARLLAELGESPRLLGD